MTDSVLARSRRAFEARMLVGALALTLFMHYLLRWTVEGDADIDVVGFGLIYGGFGLALHLAVRRYAPLADPTLAPLAYLLNGIGLVFVRRLDGPGENLAAAQLGWTAVAVAMAIGVLVVIRDHRVVARYQYILALVTLLLLASPALPGIGREINGSRLWLRFAGFQIQPGEIAKLTMVGFLAGYLERTRGLLRTATTPIGPFRVPEPRHLAVVLGAGLAALGLMVGARDLGSSVLFFGVFVAMLYIATDRLAYPIVGGVFFAGGVIAASRFFSHVQTRFDAWLRPFEDIDGSGFQIVQAIFALASGGLTGSGIGQGRPDAVPFAETDFIFAAIAEELGMLGAIAVLAAFTVLVVRGFKIALSASDEAGTLLAAGLSVTLGLQVLIIVGGVTRLIPLTGITLPFISYGGSSLLANYLLIALLLIVSHRSRASEVAGPTGGTR